MVILALEGERFAVRPYPDHDFLIRYEKDLWNLNEYYRLEPSKRSGCQLGYVLVVLL